MALIVTAFFTESSGVPKTGLTLSDIDLYLTARKRSDGSTTVVWDGTQNPSEEVDNVGAYTKAYTDDNTTVYDYFGMAHYAGAETLDYDDVTAGLGELGSRVWEWTPRTLTQTAASVVSAVSGSGITITRGDSFSGSLTGMGSIANRSKLWFAVKWNKGDADANALVLIEETSGLVYVNGAAAETATNGSITVVVEDDGDITIVIDEAETANFAEASVLYYDVQVLTTDGDVNTLTSGDASVILDVTRAIT